MELNLIESCFGNELIQKICNNEIRDGQIVGVYCGENKCLTLCYSSKNKSLIYPCDIDTDFYSARRGQEISMGFLTQRCFVFAIYSNIVDIKQLMDNRYVITDKNLIDQETNNQIKLFMRK